WPSGALSWTTTCWCAIRWQDSTSASSWSNWGLASRWRRSSFPCSLPLPAGDARGEGVPASLPLLGRRLPDDDGAVSGGGERQPADEGRGAQRVPGLGVHALHQPRRGGRRRGADPSPGSDRVLKPASSRADSHRDRRRRRDDLPGPRPRGAYQGGVRHCRRGRYPPPGRSGMMLDNLAVAQVVAPLAAAPACLLPWRRVAWLLATPCSGFSFACALVLLGAALDGGVVVSEIGGWPAPFGIEYRIDLANALVLTNVSGISTIVLVTAFASLDGEIEPGRQPLFYSVWLLCLSGLLGMAATADAFNFFVFLEISSLSSYALIAMGRDRRALTAAFQYLVMGTIGATFILIAVAFLYLSTGTLNMADMAERLPSVSGSRTVASAFAFLTVGIGLKMAMFPLHQWLPNAYAFAPGAVSAFLAATATKVAVYGLVRFVFSVFGVDYSFGSMPLPLVLAALAAAAVL